VKIDRCGFNQFSPAALSYQAAIPIGARQMMTAVPKDEAPSLLNLVIVGAVAVATVAIFFGIGFLWLALPYRSTPPADPVPPAQALEAREPPPSSNSETAWGTSPAPAGKVAESSTLGASSDREARASEATALISPVSADVQAAAPPIIPSVGITHAKRTRVSWHRRGRIVRRWVAFWRRPYTYPGPNPGGGFYGPPNINVGYINPR
jgi:hypothetical protein